MTIDPEECKFRAIFRRKRFQSFYKLDDHFFIIKHDHLIFTFFKSEDRLIMFIKNVNACYKCNLFCSVVKFNLIYSRRTDSHQQLEAN